MINKEQPLLQSKGSQKFRRGGFTFKQFFIAHDQCAMKVGTDSILLGAWSDVTGASRILDLGTGSGLLALMLAQRTDDNVLIKGIELDSVAALQAQQNSSNSPWSHRVQIEQGDVIDWAAEHSACYDLVVTNPPYFAPGVSCRGAERSMARYTEKLTHDALLLCMERLLVQGGRFCVVLPYNIALAFQQSAERRGWCARNMLTVRHSKVKVPHLLLLEFMRGSTGTLLGENIDIRDDFGHFSCRFRDLTKDFYIFF